MRGAELRTGRLVVRTPMKGDGVKYARYYTLNREFLQPYSPKFDAGMFSASEWESSIPLIQQQFANGTTARFVLMLGDELIGVANLTQIQRGPSYSAILGYTLSEEHQGHGYMKEALGEVVRYMFEARNLHRIVANYMPRNERSGRLLRSLGFQVEGYARDYLLIDGVWEDHVLSARTNPDWKG
ncbi:GNAT family N-acetyltransferase [Fimbriimonas ginsengisoli]|uniref:Ribosomal-protein-S5-alanine N-acetyltransferase n=1 Tax=Fimbriimonas ginsengisoli Gsoil 348 TaxID=661478 RepID=A0A068NU50_FIMGI|nr:GNAT family N-acetyltransferase [Fimbriimonas ginsengisoli]AIE86310.1 ribosomal-protein-S5-alanine N-acetyltransferase [Fimbriimonas ginsengisoli Gsoil 348]